MCKCTLSITSAIDWSGWLTTRLGRFNPRKKETLPIVQEHGWVLGPVWTDGENLAPTAIGHK